MNKEKFVEVAVQDMLGMKSVSFIKLPLSDEEMEEVYKHFNHEELYSEVVNWKGFEFTYFVRYQLNLSYLNEVVKFLANNYLYTYEDLYKWGLKNKHIYDRFYDISELDRVFKYSSPTEILKAAYNINLSDDYVYIDANGQVSTCNKFERAKILKDLGSDMMYHITDEIDNELLK